MMETLINALVYLVVRCFALAAGWFVAFWVFSALAYCISWVYSKKGKHLDVSGYSMIGHLVLVILFLSPAVGIAAKSMFIVPLSLIVGLVVLYHTQNLWIINRAM